MKGVLSMLGDLILFFKEFLRIEVNSSLFELDDRSRHLMAENMLKGYDKSKFKYMFKLKLLDNEKIELERYGKRKEMTLNEFKEFWQNLRSVLILLPVIVDNDVYVYEVL